MDLPTPGEIVLYRPTEEEALRWGAGPWPFLVCVISDGPEDRVLWGHVFVWENRQWVRRIPYGTAPGCWQWRGKTKQA